MIKNNKKGAKYGERNNSKKEKIQQYNQLPEVKARKRKYQQKWYQKNKEKNNSRNDKW